MRPFSSPIPVTLNGSVHLAVYPQALDILIVYAILTAAIQVRQQYSEITMFLVIFGLLSTRMLRLRALLSP